jgi:hypothetical protein
MTIDLMFNAIADHMPGLTPAGTPERLRSAFINGIKHWQVDYTPHVPRGSLELIERVRFGPSRFGCTPLPPRRRGTSPWSAA